MDDGGLIWLASFPKSGNTWLRAFICAYQMDQPPDINNLIGTVTDQSYRWYQACSSDNVAEMEPHILALLHPAAMLNMRNSIAWSPKLVKTHNANVTVSGCPLIPYEITHKAVYLVRDPRDVAISYAKHFGVSVETAIDRMCDDGVALFDPKGRPKAMHWTCSWAQHVASYVDAEGLDVTVVRYEDLKTDPVRFFAWILKWIGLPPDMERVKRAVDNCALGRLRAQEEKNGFREASDKADKFFGEGGSGAWVGKIPPAALAKLERHARHVMEHFGYELAALRGAA